MEADRLAGTEPLAEGGKIDRQRLAAFIRDNVPGCSGEMEIERFRGGQSNPTMLLSFANGRRLVLRKKPDGTLLPSAHAVDREFRVIRALAETDVPVPQAHVLCDDETIVGPMLDRKSTRLNSSHVRSSYAVFCLKKKHVEPVMPRVDINIRLGRVDAIVPGPQQRVGVVLDVCVPLAV